MGNQTVAVALIAAVTAISVPTATGIVGCVSANRAAKKAEEVKKLVEETAAKTEKQGQEIYVRVDGRLSAMFEQQAATLREVATLKAEIATLRPGDVHAKRAATAAAQTADDAQTNSAETAPRVKRTVPR